MTTDADKLQAEVDRLTHELKVLKVEDGGEEIYVGSYLLTRLEQLGVKSMFGVPGDFNLAFLDLVEDHPTIDWVGNCNELNAAYAADGYSRVREHSIGVVLTTFGVGELSAINGIAGAFSEMVPVLHIAGVPSTSQQKAKPLLHHTLGDGRFDAYVKAAEQVTVTQGILTSAVTAAAEIDRVLTECITKARPVYLTLPTDIAYAKVSSKGLRTPLSRAQLPNDPAVEAFVLDEISKLVEAAGEDVVVLVDACTIRHDVRDEVKELVEKTGFPVYAAPMGKTAIDESYERYGGIYLGSVTLPAVKERVESAKLILSVGSLKSDYNTGNFTYNIPTSSTIELHSDHTRVQYATFPGIGMKYLLPALTARLATLKAGAAQADIPHFTSLVPPYRAVVPHEEGDAISHAWFWPTVGEFFRPGDVVVSETGTSNFGLMDVPFPERSVFVTQVLWGSIGWALGSTLGAALAARERSLGRTMLFIGDGSIQLTVQELSTMARKGLAPIVFVLNNNGYTIERYIHGMERKYNDIVNWKWTRLLDTLGADEASGKSKSYTVRTKSELAALLGDASFAEAGRIQLVEVIMDPRDAPRALKVTTGTL